MKFKGVLLDIDNTLYEYESVHNAALNAVAEYFLENKGVSKEIFMVEYQKARRLINKELIETASSHNRILYFQRVLESLDLNPQPLALKLYNVYWDEFIDSIKVYDGVYEFLSLAKNKICFITDLTAETQFRKIEKLGLGEFSNKIVTSEEAGVEKPHPYIFMLALKKLNLKPEEVCMVGDSYKKDIQGAIDLGIHSFWLNNKMSEGGSGDLITEIASFEDLMEKVI